MKELKTVMIFDKNQRFSISLHIEIKMSIEKLPPDIIRYILNMLDDNNLLNLNSISKTIYNCCNNSFWLNRIMRCYPLSADEINEAVPTSSREMPYRAYYQDLKKFEDALIFAGTMPKETPLNKRRANNLIVAANMARIDLIKIVMRTIIAEEMREHTLIQNSLRDSLLQCCRHGDLEIVKFLLDNGAIIYVDDALEISCIQGWYEIVRLLIEYGADVQYGEDFALRSAIDEHHRKVVKLLLDNGADIHTHNEYPLIQACRNNDRKIVRLLLDYHADVHVDNEDPLCLASESGHTEIVEMLLKAGANIHIDDDRPLRVASKNGYIDTVRLLLRKGANVRASEDYALRLSAAKGHTEIVKLLLRSGADVHASEDYALREASMFGHTEVVKILLENGADIHVKNNTPIRLASDFRRHDIYRILLAAGADPGMMDLNHKAYVTFWKVFTVIAVVGSTHCILEWVRR